MDARFLVEKIECSFILSPRPKPTIRNQMGPNGKTDFSKLCTVSYCEAFNYGYMLASACSAVSTAVFTISSTVAPLLRSFTGFFSPCKIGPTAIVFDAC